MSRYLSIYLTEEIHLARLADIGVSKFNPPLGFNEQLPFYLISESAKIAKSSIDERDFPQGLLAHNDMEMDDFCKNVSKISEQYDEIFIVYHGLPKYFKPSNITDNIHNSFKDKSEMILGRHTGSDSLYKLALNFVYANSPEEIKLAAKKAFDVFKDEKNLNMQRKALKNIPPFKVK